MKNKKLCLLIGNIGSGKSNICKELVSDKRYVVISRDGLRYSIGAGNYIFNNKLEPWVWEVEFDMFNSAIEHKIQKIVLDEVNVTKKMRSRYINLGISYGYSIIGIELPRFDRILSVNNRMVSPHGKDKRIVWEGVWDKFDKMYEEPCLGEGFDKLYKLNGWNDWKKVRRLL